MPYFVFYVMLLTVPVAKLIAEGHFAHAAMVAIVLVDCVRPSWGYYVRPLLRRAAARSRRARARQEREGAAVRLVALARSKVIRSIGEDGQR